MNKILFGILFLLAFLFVGLPLIVYFNGMEATLSFLRPILEEHGETLKNIGLMGPVAIIIIVIVVGMFLLCARIFFRIYRNHQILKSRGVKDFAKISSMVREQYMNEDNEPVDMAEIVLEHSLPIIKKWRLKWIDVQGYHQGDYIAIIYDPENPEVSNLLYIESKPVLKKNPVL